MNPFCFQKLSIGEMRQSESDKWDPQASLSNWNWSVLPTVSCRIMLTISQATSMARVSTIPSTRSYRCIRPLSFRISPAEASFKITRFQDQTLIRKFRNTSLEWQPVHSRYWREGWTGLTMLTRFRKGHAEWSDDVRQLAHNIALYSHIGSSVECTLSSA